MQQSHARRSADKGKGQNGSRGSRERGKRASLGAKMASKDTVCVAVWWPCRPEKVRRDQVSDLGQAASSSSKTADRPARNCAVTGAKTLQIRSNLRVFAPVHANLRHDSGQEG